MMLFFLDVIIQAGDRVSYPLRFFFSLGVMRVEAGRGGWKWVEKCKKQRRYNNSKVSSRGFPFVRTDKEAEVGTIEKRRGEEQGARDGDAGLRSFKSNQILSLLSVRTQ